MLGLNKIWITLSVNLMDFPPIGAYDRTELYVFTKATLYQTFQAAYAAFSDTQGQFTPAIDLDQSTDTMYFAQGIPDPTGGRIRMSQLQAPGSESFTPGTAQIAPARHGATRPRRIPVSRRS